MKDLLKMQRYQLTHNRTYWGGMLGVLLIGFLTAETYVPEVMEQNGKAASLLTDIFNGMVYDSTFLLIFICSLLALLFGQEFSCRTINQEVSAGHKRSQIFSSKVLTYIIAFNLMAMVYPIAGCIREYLRFGIAEAGGLFYTVIKAFLYSILLNSAMFFIAILCCCYFRSTIKTVTFTASITFALCLYLGYGTMLKLPVSFLPIYQIRKAISSQGIFVGSSFAAAVVWITVLAFLSWHIFHKCDLK